MSSHPKYRIMILDTLKEINKGPFSRLSRYAISKKILENFPSIIKNHHFKRNMRISLRNLEGKGAILRIKQSFRRAAESKNQLKRIRIKHLAKLPKKVSNKELKKSILKKPMKRQTPKKLLKVKTLKGRNSKVTINPKVQKVIKHIKAMNQPLPLSLISLTNSDSKLKDNRVIWQYYDNSNQNAIVKSIDGWYDYDRKASDIIEEEWQKYIKNRAMCDVRAVKSGRYTYQVDFINWTQQNLDHNAHTKRIIRRLDEYCKATINPYQ